MNIIPEKRPRVGVPYRNAAEEAEGRREKCEYYLRAIREAGGEPVEISLSLLSPKLAEMARTLDAVVLPGSPLDVDPMWYHAARHPETADADPFREQTDFALLDHAFTAHKPVLAICYGLQSLNVWRGGTLIQHIPGEIEKPLQHEWANSRQGAPEPHHAAHIEADTLLAHLAGATEVQINSSHHQAIKEPGRDLRVVAHAPDGVVEAVQFTGDASHWVVGVQWHPERMVGDAFASALFHELVAATRRVTA